MKSAGGEVAPLHGECIPARGCGGAACWYKMWQPRLGTCTPKSRPGTGLPRVLPVGHLAGGAAVDCSRYEDELFGTARGGALAGVFRDFMERQDCPAVPGHPIQGAADFVFDAALPAPSVLPAALYDAADSEDRAWLLEVLQLGARDGVAFEMHPDLEACHLGFAASPFETHAASIAYPPGAHVPRLHGRAWIAGHRVFRPAEWTPLDDAEPIVFRPALEFLQAAAVFRRLIALGAAVRGQALGANGGHHRPAAVLDPAWWDAEVMRVDFGRGVLFERTFMEREPWRAVFCELFLLPASQVTEVDEVPAGDGRGAAERRAVATEIPHGHAARAVHEAAKQLIDAGRDPLARTFPGEVHEALGSPETPSKETVRKYLKPLRQRQ